MRWIEHVEGFCGACNDSKESSSFSEHWSSKYASIFWVNWAKAIERNVVNVWLYNFWRWYSTFYKPSAQWQVISVARNAFNLAKIAIVPTSTPESDDEATEKTEKPRNEYRTRSSTSWPNSWRLSSETSLLHDPLMEVCIVAKWFMTSADRQNLKSKPALSWFKRI